MTDTDDTPVFDDTTEQMTTLENMSGQSIIKAETAYEHLRHHAQHWEGAYELQEEIAEMSTMAYEERAIVRAEPWTPILSVHAVSELLVEKKGGEPSTASYGGTGFRLDAQHEENMKTLADTEDDDE